MKAISLWQPWASLVADGLKRIETRSWPTSYRGPLAIHAANGGLSDAQMRRWLYVWRCKGLLDVKWFESAIERGLPRGAIIAVSFLVDCVPTRRPDQIPDLTRRELEFGNYTEGRFAWILSRGPRLADPIPCRGRQGLFDWDADRHAWTPAVPQHWG